MMSIFDAYVPAAYGALDSDALQEDLAVSAAKARAIAGAANRLTQKGAHWWSILWPSLDDADVSVDLPAILQKTFSDFVWRHWSPLVGPFPAPKKHGLTMANIRMTAMVSGTDAIQLQFATRESPFTENPGAGAANVLTITGDGDDDWDDYDLDDLPVTRGGQEEFTVYVRSVSQGALGTTGTYGNPNTGDLGKIEAAAVYVLDTNWNDTASNLPTDYASAGHYIVLNDSFGNVVATRTIVNVGARDLPSGLGVSHQPIVISPELTGGQQRLLQGGTFEVRELPKLAITSITAHLQGRLT